MSKLRKNFITLLAVLLCAMLALSAALIIPKYKNAEAYASPPTTANIGELYIGGDNKFSAANLRKLYNALYEGAKSLDDVEDNLTITTGGNNTIARKDIIIEFCGMKWTAMYLSRATEERKNVGGAPASSALGAATKDDVVLTLWLVNPESTAANRAQWQYWTKSGDIPGNETNKYPANMYGTSYIRSQVLNNGGAYWNQNTANLTDGLDTLIQDANLTSKKTTNKFARFTMPDATDSVVNYLVSPRYIEWQYEQHKGTLAGWSSSANPELLYDTNNDSWGVNVKAYFEGNGKWFYADKTGAKDYYSVWKDDLLWLPSIAETGQGLDDGSYGLWKTRLEQRASAAEEENFSWLRSSSCPDTYNIRASNVYGNASNRVGNTLRIVRPALHLNLTEAAKAAKGVSFDNVGLENVENGAEFTAGEGEHTFSRVFDGKEVKVTLPEAKNGEKMTVTGANYAQEVFSAKYPYESEDRTYEVTATLQGDYVWDDTDDTTKNKEPRKYKITIERAKIEIDGGWGRLNVAYGASLLGQDTSKIKSPKLQAEISFTPTVEYIVVTPDGTFDENSPPSEADSWSATPENSTATATGSYHVWYRISADYHKDKTGFYEVKVSQDSLTVEADETEITGEYGQFNGSFNPKDQDWLKEQFSDKVTIKSDSKTYDNADDVLKFLNDEELVVYMFNDDGEVKENKYERYDAGTYFLGLKDDSGSFSFVWKDDKYPVVKITKPTVQVEIIGKDGAELKSIYGDNPVELEYSVKSGLLENEKPEDLNLRYDSFKLDDGSSLTKTTPANTYNITGAARGSNYEINFLRSEYTVDPRPIKLKVADETAEYGTDFSKYKFKELTVAEGDLVGSDAVPAAIRYYLWYTTGEMELSSTLSVGKHSLCAEATSSNYDIEEIIAGTLTITKANFDMSGVRLDNAGYVYNGQPHPAQISGTLPEGVSVSFRYVNIEDGSESTDPPVELGLYLAYATFTHSNENYNEITDKVAYIRIAETQEEADKPFPAPPTQEEIAAAAELAKKKAEAKAELEAVAEAKKEEIAALEISDEEKDKANSEIDKELADGNAAIAAANGASGVEQAFDDAKKKIEDISAACKAAEERAKKEAEERAELESKKSAAKDALDAAAQAKKDAIDNDPNLTDEEKAAAKAEVDKELEEGKKAIDNASSLEDVESAESATKANIENIKPEHKGDFPWWIIAVAAGLLILAIVVIIVIKKRQVADGDEDFDDYYGDDYDYDEEDFEEDDFSDDEDY